MFLSTRGKTQNEAIKAMADFLDLNAAPAGGVVIAVTRLPGDADSSPFVARVMTLAEPEDLQPVNDMAATFNALLKPYGLVAKVHDSKRIVIRNDKSLQQVSELKFSVEAYPLINKWLEENGVWMRAGDVSLQDGQELWVSLQ